MIHQNIIDNELVAMYDAKASLEEMMTHFDASHSTIYSHLKNVGVIPNRKVSPNWSDLEDYQLIAEYIYNTTGRDYCRWVPTRSYAAIKARLRMFRRVKGGVVR